MIRALTPISDLGVRTSPNGLAHDLYWPRADDWAVLESLRSPRDNVEERDEEDQRFIALMLGGDAFD